MRTESELLRGRWPAQSSGGITSRSKQVNSCNKENVLSREQLFQRVMSPQNQRLKTLQSDGDANGPGQKLRQLTNRRERLLREKLSYSTLFAELLREKERLESTNQRLLQEEELYRKRLHEMEREQLAQYRNNERQKEQLLDKIQMLSQMESDSGVSRIGEVEAELQKVKQLFFQQEQANTQRYNSLLKESEELQQQNRRLKDYLEGKRKPYGRSN